MYRRKNTLRLKDYDYSLEGAYFVTISCKNKNAFFNRSIFKEVAEEILEELAETLNIKIDHYCIMLDHIHLILFFKQKKDFTLSQVIQRFKSLVANKIREKFGVREKIWQRGFYDHIIRNQQDYLEKTQYILNNELKKELENENI
jgi:putative transposase